MLVSLEELKEYLRVDVDDEDMLLTSLLETAVRLCMGVARQESVEDFESLGAEAKTAVLYATAYLYEHREEADHRNLALTLRSLLFNVRREGF